MVVLPVFFILIKGFIDDGSKLAAQKHQLEHALSVLANCSKENHIKISWQRPQTYAVFDVDVRYFYPISAAEIATSNCIVERAPDHFLGKIDDYDCDNPNADRALRRTVTGELLAPPAVEEMSFEFIKCASADTQTIENPA